jgi:tetratricopeptide (TPR) repeat protein
MFKSLFKTTTLALSFVAISHAQAYDNLELKTSYEDIPGVRNIEAGQYQAGIHKLQTLLGNTRMRELTAPAQTNLCVAYTALGQLSNASTYCEQAIKQHSSKRDLSLAYNNRAVLHYVQGKTELSLQDMQKATELNPANSLAARNLARLTATDKSTQILSSLN